MGVFNYPAQLCDAFGTDDRIKGVIQTRLDALASLPLEVTPPNTRKRSARIADRIKQNWNEWLCDAEIKRLHKWGLFLGIGIGELEWTATENEWTPHLKTWDLRHCSWRWDTRSFWMSTADGPVEVLPGNGRWVVYAPHGLARGWMEGLVRSLALLFLIRRWAWRDWARWSEVHGLPIKLLTVPSDARAEDKEDIERALSSIGGEGLIRLAKDENGNGFDLDLLEAAAQSYEGFLRLIEKADECIAVDVLGQNLTTSMKGGGSYAAANVHDRIRLDRLESDARGLGKCFTDQVVRPWVEYNIGDSSLTPNCTWSTKAPDERGSIAKTLVDLGTGVSNLRKGGMNVDREKIAKQFHIPLVEGEPTLNIPPTENINSGNSNAEKSA